MRLCAIALVLLLLLLRGLSGGTAAAAALNAASIGLVDSIAEQRRLRPGCFQKKKKKKNKDRRRPKVSG